MAEDIRVGDVVRLAIGPEMQTVGEWGEGDGRHLVCVWFLEGGDFRSAPFPAVALTGVPFVDKRLAAIERACREMLGTSRSTEAWALGETILAILGESP